MPDQLLTFLKYIFLALLYLFFVRVLRAVWIELREPKPAPVAAPRLGGVGDRSPGGATAAAARVRDPAGAGGVARRSSQPPGRRATRDRGAGRAGAARSSRSLTS